MRSHDITIIGPVTRDSLKQNTQKVESPGGTVYYATHALKYFDVDCAGVVKLNQEDYHLLDSIRSSQLYIRETPQTCEFENHYEKDTNIRIQKVKNTIEPFKIKDLEDIESNTFHLGPLMNSDFDFEVFEFLSQKGKLSLDIQGLMRKTSGDRVVQYSNTDLFNILKYVHIIKLNEEESALLLGSGDHYSNARQLSEYGIKEIIITLGSKGALIYDGKEYCEICAYNPGQHIDPTGCGDTFMAGYLYYRFKGNDILNSAHYGSVMGALNGMSIGSKGYKESYIHEIRQSYR